MDHRIVADNIVIFRDNEIFRNSDASLDRSHFVLVLFFKQFFQWCCSGYEQVHTWPAFKNRLPRNVGHALQSYQCHNQPHTSFCCIIHISSDFFVFIEQSIKFDIAVLFKFLLWFLCFQLFFSAAASNSSIFVKNSDCFRISQTKMLHSIERDFLRHDGIIYILAKIEPTVNFLRENMPVVFGIRIAIWFSFNITWPKFELVDSRTPPPNNQYHRWFIMLSD